MVVCGMVGSLSVRILESRIFERSEECHGPGEMIDEFMVE